MGEELFTIGRLARRTGVSVRTIRFWPDTGVLTPAGRSSGGYRLYDAEAVARLDLVQTLRELGLGLDVVRAVLARRTTLAEVADVHVTAGHGDPHVPAGDTGVRMADQGPRSPRGVARERPWPAQRTPGRTRESVCG